MVRDHPRIRGEHGATWEIRDRSPSSSPHTRGARNLLHGNIGAAKIIPAYAGSTDDASRLCSRIEDHPRIRGEHLVIGDEKHNHRGSSPHTRGARRTAVGCSRRVGDHPRIRGEHHPSTLRRTHNDGSSPHTRGARFQEDVADRLSRIIPAYAGSTISPRPRTRSETGSSPHTRGAHVTEIQAGGGVRIIPAYAGSTYYPTCCRTTSADHPRIRGEHPPSGLWCPGRRGSSPHTRGARRRRPARARRPGIIPAYAGSTGRTARSTPRKPDHPRIRGEHEHLPAPGQPAVGSSPHTRGARHFP